MKAFEKNALIKQLYILKPSKHQTTQITHICTSICGN